MLISALVAAVVVFAEVSSPPFLDLAREFHRQTIVDREPRQYLGHPSTVRVDDHTLLCAYPAGHGKGAIRMRSSANDGRTWSPLLPVPASFATSLETPTLFRVEDPLTHAPRLLLFSGLYPIRLSISDDLGATWSELTPIGDFGGIVAMSSLLTRRDGSLVAYFHDDGRYLAASPGQPGFAVFATSSRDGGRTWSAPETVLRDAAMQLCEPGIVRDPESGAIAMLLRENSRKRPSQVVFSDDDGATWSAPRDLPPWLVGDRHVAIVTPDRRLVVVLRDMQPESPTKGDFVAWIGSFRDLRDDSPGLCRLRLLDNHNEWDCGYAGLEIAGSRLIATTYGHFRRGDPPFVVSVGFTLPEILTRLRGALSPEAPTPMRPTDRGNPEATTDRARRDQEAIERSGARIVFLGDSITEGWNDAGRGLFETRFAPRAALNLGVSGETSSRLLGRLDHGILDSLAKKPVESIVLLIGTNDIGDAQQSPAEIASGVGAIVTRLREKLPNARIALFGVFPRDPTADSPLRARIRALNDWLELMDDEKTVFYRDIGNRFLASDGSTSPDVMSDALHLSARGYAIWADVISMFLDTR